VRARLKTSLQYDRRFSFWWTAISLASLILYFPHDQIGTQALSTLWSIGVASGALLLIMKIVVFWVVAPCSLVEVYQRFRGPCCLHHQGDSPRRQQSSYSPPWEPQILLINCLTKIWRPVVYNNLNWSYLIWNVNFCVYTCIYRERTAMKTMLAINNILLWILGNAVNNSSWIL
jgi:hypothetical protein